MKQILFVLIVIMVGCKDKKPCMVYHDSPFKDAQPGDSITLVKINM